METIDEIYDLLHWWIWAKVMFLRAGKPKSSLEKEKRRVLRWMEVRSMEEVQKDGPIWWLIAVAWARGEMSEVVTMIGAVSEEIIHPAT